MDSTNPSSEPKREPIAQLRGVGRTYRVFNKPSDRLKQQLFGARKRYYTEVDALHDVSLDLYRGEIFAIVGQNGSGKSTLLKILAGTLKQSSGSVSCIGRVAALLELGAGFNQELTGRENARVSAAMLGLDAKATQAWMPAIEHFADIGAFFDLPVKTYSSGMFARVAFATMVATRPDVLIVDEILAVGDEPFQRKCFDRIMTMAESGTAIVFVTHNTPLVVQVAHRAMLLERGRCTLAGVPRDVANQYYRTLSLGAAPADDVARATAADGEPTADALFDPTIVSSSTTEYARSGAFITDARLLDGEGRRVNQLLRGREYEFRYRVTLTADVDRLECGSMIRNVAGVDLGGMLADFAPPDVPLRAGTEYLARIRFCCRLLPGTYFFNAGVRGGLGTQLRYLHRVLDVLAFRVVPEADLAVTGMVDFSTPTPASVEPACAREQS